MTYITDQTSEELRAHMKRITSMEGWNEPVIARLWKEIQELENKAITQAEVDAYLAERGLVAITQDRLDIEHDVASLQGWLDGRSDALQFGDVDAMSVSKHKQLGELRKQRRAMIKAAKGES